MKMSGSKVHRVCCSEAQHIKQMMHFLAKMLVFLLLICCCNNQQCNAMKLFPMHKQANIFNKFASTLNDENLPMKSFSPKFELQPGLDWQIKNQVQRYENTENADDLSQSDQLSAVSSSTSAEQMIEKSPIANDARKDNEEQKIGISKLMLLPRRERRFNWNRWVQWFSPQMERTSSGFMPVRGPRRKTTFIAARGKKSMATKSMMVDHKEEHSTRKGMSGDGTRYYLVALTIKPLLRSVPVLDA